MHQKILNIFRKRYKLDHDDLRIRIEEINITLIKINISKSCMNNE